MSKVVIIMGTGSSQRFCDFKADEIWGVNGVYTTPRVMPERIRHKFFLNKLFLTDTLYSHETGSLNFDIDVLNKFSDEYKCQIISLNKMRLGKHKMNCKPYPWQKIVDYFHTDYFTDTICYMLAYLLYTHTYLAKSPDGVIRPELKQPLKIKFYGIDMSTTREYQQSKGGVEYWLGIANGLGCEFENSPGSVICMHPQGVPYGRWDLLAKDMKKNKKKYDPMGAMNSDKEPTTADADKMLEKELKDEQMET